MAGENKIDVLQIVCLGVGIFLGMLLVRILLGFGGILGGALGGGLGAAIGIGIYALISKSKGENGN